MSVLILCRVGYRPDAVCPAGRGQQKTGIAVAKPVTGCKRPFSELFNVAASRPAKSPRKFIAILRLRYANVNGGVLVSASCVIYVDYAYCVIDTGSICFNHFTGSSYRMEAGMPGNTAVPASDFARNFAKYQDEAIAKKVINVTSHGRIVGAYLSAAEFAHYELLKRREREILIVGDLDEGTIASIKAAEYGVEPK